MNDNSCDDLLDFDKMSADEIREWGIAQRREIDAEENKAIEEAEKYYAAAVANIIMHYGLMRHDIDRKVEGR